MAVTAGPSGAALRPLAEALVAALARFGVRAEVATPTGDHDGVVFLGGLAEIADREAALQVQREAFAAARAVASRLSSEGGIFVTVQDTGGGFGLRGEDGLAGPRAWLGGLPGLAKTAAQEWPKAGLRALDLRRDGRSAESLAEALAEELLAGGTPSLPGASGGGVEVALGSGDPNDRSTLLSVPVAAAPTKPRVHAGSVIVASGGARGVTAHTLVALARATSCKLALLGRSALVDEPASCAGARTDAELKGALLKDAKATGEKLTPKDLGRRTRQILASREIRQTLEAIAAAGGTARYLVADVQDREAVNAALTDVRQSLGPVTGVVHGAGVLADKLIAEKSPEDFDWVLSVKAGGLAVLLDATAGDPLDVLVAFSSVAGRCGNRGQVDYAMANETLNKVLQARSVAAEGALTCRSLGWGPWEGGMVTPALKAHFERLGVPLIGLDAGAQMLVDEIADASDSVELVLGGEPKPEPLAGETEDVASQRLSVHVDARRFPALLDHRVEGQAVMPVALVLELLTRAAEASALGQVCAALEDVKVLKGIVLGGAEGAGDRFTIVVQGEGERRVLTLEDAEGRPRYRAVARLGAELPGAPAAAAVPEGLGSYEGQVYDGGRLFHGPAFQVLGDDLEHGDAAMVVSVAGLEAMGWERAPAAHGAYATDPALIDGGLQLALLTTALPHPGASALPTAVGRFERHVAGPAAAPLEARVHVRSRSALKTVCDVDFVDPDGRVFASLGAVETHLRPNATVAVSAPREG